MRRPGISSVGGGGTSDHGELDGLSDDDHSQYLLLGGRSSGQTINGGTASGGTLTLNSTSNATKGKILLGSDIAYDQANSRLGIGTTSPVQQFHQKNDEDNPGNVFLFEASGSTASNPAQMSFLHGGDTQGVSGTKGVSFVPKDQGSRSKMIFSSDGGGFIRFSGDQLSTVTWEAGCKSNTISNRPSYWKSNNQRHMLIRPGGSKQVFIANIDEGGNAGNPSGMLHIENNVAGNAVLYIEGAPSQSGNFFECRDSGGTLLSYIDHRGNIVFQSYTDANRPNANQAGRVIFNTDDGNLNICDGANWLLPDGTTT